jgi:excisionase family DNA binding protein
MEKRGHEIGATLSTRPLAVGPAEAARLVNLGRTRLYEELGTGALPSFRVGRRRLIRLSAIEDWISAREAKA